MKFPSLLRACLLLSGLALTIPTVHAADAPSATVSPPPSFILEIRHNEIIDNGKSAGPAVIGNILDYLKKKNVDIDLALGPGVSNVVVGDLVLHLDPSNPRALCLDLCLALKTSASQPLRAGLIDPDGSSLYGLIAEKQEHEVAVFNLSSYLNPDGNANDKAIQEKLASVTDIIFKTLRDADPTFSDAAQPHYQFHQGANLLVVTGSEQAIDVATKVVNALMPSSNPFSSPSSAPATWSSPTPIAGATGTFVLPSAQPGSGSSGVSAPQTVPTLPGAINAGGDSSPGSRKARDLAVVNANAAQLQAMLNALQQAAKQGSLSPEQLKQVQQQLDMLNSDLQNLDQRVKAIQNNSPVIIQNPTGGGSSSGSP